MARPTSWLDLSKYDRRGNMVVQFCDDIMGYPSIAKHVVAAMEAAEKTKKMFVDDDGIWMKPDPEVIEEKLRRAQERWDDLEAQYKVAKDYPPAKIPWEVNDWARSNGQPVLKAVEE